MELRDNLWHCIKCRFNAPLKKIVRMHAAQKHGTGMRGGVVKRDLQRSRFSFACPECEFRSARSNMVEHFCKAHGLELSIQHMKFPNWDDFAEWKTRMEQAFEVSYEKTADAIRMDEGRILRYTFSCFRDDFIIIQPSGSRYFTKRLCCPSDIRVHHDQNNGDVVVRFVETHFGHPNRIIDDIVAKHQVALDAETVCSLEVTDTGWTVWMDGGSGRSHFVSKNDSSCQCHLRCDPCNVCMHSFKCTCDAYSMKPTICEHIHLIATYLRAGSNEDNVETLEFKAAPDLKTRPVQGSSVETEKDLADALQTMDVLYSVIKRDVRTVQEAAMVVEGLSELISKFESLRSEENN